MLQPGCPRRTFDAGATRRESHQSDHSATTGRQRDQLEPCQLVADRCL